VRSLFAASRFVIGLAVTAAFLGSTILLAVATVTLVRIAWREITNIDLSRFNEGHIDTLAFELIEITDIILLGTVLYIVSLGLYQLFIDHKLPLPPWLKVNSLTDLKRDLIGVVVVLLGVSFLGEVVKGEGTFIDTLHLGGAVALVIAALGFFLWLSPHKDGGENS
jgi:uncharacterized membrane protein YqhA